MSKPTYYVTTPIYYPNDKLHIGHAYTTTVADTLARYKRMRGYDVHFLTGTDEHAQKIEQRAAAAGKSPMEFVDEIVATIKALWTRLDISYDDFIRTTEERHKVVVQKIFATLLEKGDIYLGEYEGWYCTPDESYWTERQLQDGRCPDCGREVTRVREKSYFFRMSRYADQLIAYYAENPDFIIPESRKHEMLNNFLLPGLEDLSISRATTGWGIPVPGDPEHVIYVWIDALTNYITSLGYLSGNAEDERNFYRYWPADVHVMAKEIVRFHTIYWPAILMALDLPLPKQVVAHGWWLMKDGKMSKSKGNTIDPNVLIDRYGADALRYFLLREVPFGQDGVFTLEALMERLNFDLANDLGNLLHRTLAMVERFAEGMVPVPGPLTELEREVQSLVTVSIAQAEEAIEHYEFSAALTAIWQMVRRGNRYIDETAPWALSKAGDFERLGTVLYTALDLLRIISVVLTPFMPATPSGIRYQLGMNEDSVIWDDAKSFALIPSGVTVRKGDPLFPRLDVAEEIAQLMALMGGEVRTERKEDGEGLPAVTDAAPELDILEQITIDDFGKIDLRVARVIAAERIEKADKLLKLQLDLGGETRQVVSGIAKHFTPEQLIGQQVILVANLKPVKLRGVESHGMILAASQGDALTLATVARTIAEGSRVK